MYGARRSDTEVNNDAVLRLLNGTPNSVTVRTTPFTARQKLKVWLGGYAQGQWNLKRVTVNVGGRLDYLNAYVPANDLPAVRYVDARSCPQVNCAPCWTDFSPRLGLAWDVFGNARTAVKVSVGRYIEGITDLRLTRRFRIGGVRLDAQLDLYNLFNANPVTALNAVYGSAWLRPITILPGRLFKTGVQLEF